MFLIFRKYGGEHIREQIIVEEFKKQKITPPYNRILIKLTDAFELHQITREFFVGQLDCYLFYCQFRLFNKCFQHACNSQDLQSFADFLPRIKLRMETNKKYGTYGFRPAEDSNVTKVYLWARIITLNELVINDDLSAVFRKEHQQKIEEKIKNEYFPILNFIVPNVLSKIIVDYLNDFLFIFRCILSTEIVEEEIKLIIPTWDSIIQPQVTNYDFWK